MNLLLTSLDLIVRLAALMPPPGRHRHRYYGVLAPNAPLRAQVTALVSVPESPTAPLVTAAETETEPVAVQVTAPGASSDSEEQAEAALLCRVARCGRSSMPSTASSTRQLNRHRTTSSISASSGKGRTKTIRPGSSGSACIMVRCGGFVGHRGDPWPSWCCGCGKRLCRRPFRNTIGVWRGRQRGCAVPRLGPRPACRIGRADAVRHSLLPRT